MNHNDIPLDQAALSRISMERRHDYLDRLRDEASRLMTAQRALILADIREVAASIEAWRDVTKLRFTFSYKETGWVAVSVYATENAEGAVDYLSAAPERGKDDPVSTINLLIEAFIMAEGATAQPIVVWSQAGAHWEALFDLTDDPAATN
jgi:hypothetical protein